jgi:hypothetical protein
MAHPPQFDIQDSGERSTFLTGAVRDTQAGKGRFDLLPWSILWRLANHFEGGSKKYGDRNWEKGIPLGRYLDSAFRHLVKWVLGWRDEDHLIAAAWNVLCLAATVEWIIEGKLPRSLDDNNFLRPDLGSDDNLEKKAI